MRIFVALLVLLPTLSFAAEGDGRYKFVNTSGKDFLLDSQSGKIWELQRWDAVKRDIFVPVIFASFENDSFSVIPEGKYPLKYNEPEKPFPQGSDSPTSPQNKLFPKQTIIDPPK